MSKRAWGSQLALPCMNCRREISSVSSWSPSQQSVTANGPQPPGARDTSYAQHFQDQKHWRQLYPLTCGTVTISLVGTRGIFRVPVSLGLLNQYQFFWAGSEKVINRLGTWTPTGSVFGKKIPVLSANRIWMHWLLSRGYALSRPGKTHRIDFLESHLRRHFSYFSLK